MITAEGAGFLSAVFPVLILVMVFQLRADPIWKDYRSKSDVAFRLVIQSLMAVATMASIAAEGLLGIAAGSSVDLDPARSGFVWGAGLLLLALIGGNVAGLFVDSIGEAVEAAQALGESAQTRKKR